MALTKDEMYLLENVFPKVEYDDTLEKYRIRMKDYLPLKLTKEQLSLLESMCVSNGILLETPLTEEEQSLSLNEVEDMFKEYYQLKQTITTSTDKQDTSALQQKAIDIRNHLVVYYSKTMYDYILSLIPEIYSLEDYEDIFQDGYEILIKLINTYNPNKITDFDSYLRMYARTHIMRALLYRKGIKPDLFIWKYKEDLQKILGLPKENIDFWLEKKQMDADLLSLEKIAEEISQSIAEEEIMQNANAEEFYDLCFQNKSKTQTPDLFMGLDELEQEFDYQIMKAILPLLLDTLPYQQKEALIMYYGLNGQVPLNATQIGVNLQTTKQNVRNIYKYAIENLLLPARYDALKKLVMEYTNDIYLEMNSKQKSIFAQDFQSAKEFQRALNKEWRQQDYFEQMLIKTLPKEELLDMINKMGTRSRTLLIYLLQLNDGNPLTDREIREKLNMCDTVYRTNKRQSLVGLVKLLRKKYSQDSTLMSTKEFYEYVMDKHITESLRKSRHK